jgi:hypothetical protein
VQQPKERSTRARVVATEAAFDAFDEDAQASDAVPESHNWLDAEAG